MNKKELIVFVLLIVIGVVSRLIPHAPNIAAIGAIALFSGFYLPKRSALIAPLFAMLASDIFIGFYEPKLMLVVYASFAVMALCGSLARAQDNWTTRIVLMLFGSCVFFLVTNFTVWALSDFYPPTLTGLLTSYTLALPFFRNSLIGDAVYSVALFSIYALSCSQLLLRNNTRYPAHLPVLQTNLDAARVKA